MNEVTRLPQQYWSIDHEREWLASALAMLVTPEDKVRLVRNYLTALTRRYTSFDGQGPMDGAEYQDMETYCLRRLYEVEGK